MWQLPAASLTIAPGEIHLWRAMCVPTSIDFARDFESYRAQLTAQEMARAERLATATLQRRYLQAHSLLHTLLSTYTQAGSQRCELGYHANGKPFLRAPQLHPPLEFNMSHAGEAVVIALARGHEAGVDVEMVRPLNDLDGLIQATCSERERRYLATLEAETRLATFYWLWTRKEAWLKLRGIGLGEGLPTIEVDPPPIGVTLLDIPLEGTLGVEYIGAVALPGGDDDLTINLLDVIWQNN